MVYSIDTSAILNTWRHDYPPDVFPLAWLNLEELIENGILIATEEVLYELKKKDDEVFEWAQKHINLFIDSNEEIQQVVKNILRDHKKLIDTRKNRSGADPFVIALAVIKACKVVSSENPTFSAERPHIPDVCNALGITCINMLQLFREQGWVFK